MFCVCLSFAVKNAILKVVLGLGWFRNFHIFCELVRPTKFLENVTFVCTCTYETYTKSIP